jgi:hypothetical protein
VKQFSLKETIKDNKVTAYKVDEGLEEGLEHFLGWRFKATAVIIANGRVGGGRLYGRHSRAAFNEYTFLRVPGVRGDVYINRQHHSGGKTPDGRRPLEPFFKRGESLEVEVAVLDPYDYGGRIVVGVWFDPPRHAEAWEDLLEVLND